VILSDFIHTPSNGGDTSIIHPVIGVAAHKKSLAMPSEEACCLQRPASWALTNNNGLSLANLLQRQQTDSNLETIMDCFQLNRFFVKDKSLCGVIMNDFV
jgi:hypothetical protein